MIRRWRRDKAWGSLEGKALASFSPSRVFSAGLVNGRAETELT